MSIRYAWSFGVLAMFLAAISGLAQEAGKNSTAGVTPHFFRMDIYAFEGLTMEADGNREPMPGIVKRSLEKVGAFMGYKDYRAIDHITWLVRAEGNMNRFLDIPERWWSLAEETNISFKLMYNFDERFLSLNDFRFMINQVPKLHTTVGVRNNGAAILGHSKIASDGNDLFFIVTLEVRDAPFEGQHTDAVFTVFGLHGDHH